MSHKRVLIVGGVAGGASAAARVRRLSEEAEITVFERGPYVSFANCGLPYHVGGEIPDRDELLLLTPEDFRVRFNIDVRVRHTVLSVDTAARAIRVRDETAGREFDEAYDALVLAPGAAPIRPPLPGIDREGHFFVRNVPDVDQINAWLETRPVRRAVIAGGGYIGLEMAEQLHRRGLEVTLVEALPQVMAPLDEDMAGWLEWELRGHGVKLHLGDPVAAFEAPASDEAAQASTVVLLSGRRVPADLVILALGVRPEADLARAAGLEIGARGGIRVNEHQQTSDPRVWAVGDAVEVRDRITGEWTLLPLAGPANRQGRIAADHLLGRDSRYRGSLGTGLVRVFGLTAGMTGANEKTLRRVGIPYETLFLYPLSHAGYYPDAHPISLKVLFAPDTGKLLGAQIVGAAGVDKRLDVLATALHAGLTTDDLAELELGYAPPFGSAKDPVNLAGMAAQNVRRGDVRLAHWPDVEALDPRRQFLLDVRNPDEWETGHLPGATLIPLPELRARVDELPRDKEIIAYCRSGQRSYFACRFLSQRGYRVRNLAGSYFHLAARLRLKAIENPQRDAPTAFPEEHADTPKPPSTS
jgi:NADPH-dependent 2,4-dienoyl-CoA reductase/sulfur reductase-like enzyme/rhodanese-related sulfurtransferase